MKRFIDKFDENVQQNPDKIILMDEIGQVSYRQLDELSGKVYAFLQKRHIGKEDVVMISVHRGVDLYVAKVGIWKAGAVCVCVDYMYPPERVQYIYDDCHCVLNIDDVLWHQIMDEEPIFGHKETDEHDGAFICYTSGSEGHPKGVLHEYGKLEFCANSVTYNGENIFHENDKCAASSPPSVAAMQSLAVCAIYSGMMLDVLPFSLNKDVNMLAQHIRDYQITIAALIPSQLKVVTCPTQSLRMIITGIEMANGLFFPDCPIADLYAQTESCAIVCSFLIDKPYDITPIGKPTRYNQIAILDDTDHQVPDGEMGEFCYVSHYTRGYINNPQQNRDAFRNGYFHTGDIGKILPSGDVVLLGRKSDMVKINGYRIEPAEIEAAVKHILGIKWAVAKGFVSPERSYICVYYTEDVHIDNVLMREELMRVLPSYMIPSYFIRIDEIPHLPNGKVNRQKLQAPDIEQYRLEYVAPSNELEKRLCTEMEKILHIDHIGINDDFYLLGGDSLRTIQFVNNLNIKDISVSDIYSGRNPKAIAQIWMDKQLL